MSSFAIAGSKFGLNDEVAELEGFVSSSILHLKHITLNSYYFSGLF